MQKKSLVGQKFGRLLVVKELSSKIIECICDCGNKLIISEKYNLIRGNTKSCGCLKSEKASKNLKEFKANQKRQHPMIATASIMFNAKYNDGTLTKEQFIEMSQLNCFYCNKPPSNRKDSYRENAGLTEYYKNNNIFVYNGLDRIDNTLPHNYDNCVPCCKECNMSKRNMTLNDFYSMIININNSEHIKQDYEELFKFNKKDLSQLKRVKARITTKYKDINFNFELLSFIITFDCFYCGRKPSNRKKCKNGDIILCNGLDRIDQTKSHIIDNIVPCCKYCNWSKAKRSSNQFINWAENVYSNMVSKNDLIFKSLLH